MKTKMERGEEEDSRTGYRSVEGREWRVMCTLFGQDEEFEEKTLWGRNWSGVGWIRLHGKPWVTEKSELRGGVGDRMMDGCCMAQRLKSTLNYRHVI